MYSIKEHKHSGFTLIELMIVIAIIGIISGIAIPNYINYRNKAVCANIELDANSVSAAISNYFSEPNNTSLPRFEDLTGISLGKYSSQPTLSGNPNSGILISINDSSDRCLRGSVYSMTLGTAAGSWR